MYQSPKSSDDRGPAEYQSESRTKTRFHSCPIPDIVELTHVRYNEAEVPIAPHIHPNCFEVCYHYAGRQQYAVGSDTYVTQSGDFFLTFPNEVHSSGSAPEEKSSFFFMIFRCMPSTRNFMGLPDADSDWIRDTLFSCKNRVFHGETKIRSLLQQVLTIYFDGGPMQYARISALLTQFFYILCQCIIGSQTPKDFCIPKDISDIAAYIEEHPYENLSVEALARQAFLSDSQFKRKFKRYVGFSPYDYIIRQKVHCAQELLQYTTHSVTQISYELGFSSSQHFSSVFRKYIGTSPGVYRSSVLKKR